MPDIPLPTLGNEGELDRPVPHPRKASLVAHLPIDSVGQDLCKARHRRGKQLSDVSLQLKIRPDHLIAIEEGRFEALPGRVYAIGYVRSYAAYLGLDAEIFVDRLKAEIGALAAAREPAPAPDPQPLAERRLPQGTVIAGLLVVALLYSGYSVFASLGSTVEQRVMPVPARLAAEVGLADKSLAEPPPGPVDQSAAVQPSAAPEPALPPLPEVTATPRVAEPAVAAPPALAPLPPGRRYGARNRNSRITLRVHRPTYVAVRGTRNRVFIDRALFPGDTYRVPNIADLRLSTQDAGAVELILDGASVGFAGEDGAIARALSLNPQIITDRQQNG